MRKAGADPLQLFRRIHHADGVALALGEPPAWYLEAAAALAKPDENAATISGAAERVGERVLARPWVENLHRRTLGNLGERLDPNQLRDLTSEVDGLRASRR